MQIEHTILINFNNEFINLFNIVCAMLFQCTTDPHTRAHIAISELSAGFGAWESDANVPAQQSSCQALHNGTESTRRALHAPTAAAECDKCPSHIDVKPPGAPTPCAAIPNN